MSDFQKINACAKRPTDIWTNYLYYTFSLRFVYLIRNTRITPNMITLFSLFLVLVGSLFYATGTRSALGIGLVLAQASYVFDCADGQLARFRQQFSALGGWIDQLADRIKEFAVYFSLAYGYTRFHPGATGIWKWAMAALFALYLLEYLGQVDLKTRPENPAIEQRQRPRPESGTQDSLGTFHKMQRWRSLIPFRSFIIGEQYFTMLVFLAFGAVYTFYVFVAVLGLLMVLYRMGIDLYKYLRMRKSA